MELLKEFEQLDPNAYHLKVQKQTTDYFSLLQKKLKEAEKQVLN